MPDLLKAIQTFFEGCKQISEKHREAKYPSVRAPEWKLQELVKRWRIVRDGGVHCFIDKETGDVLKAETWARPAKHARGNVLDEHNGLANMGPYGPAYLR